MSNVKIRYGYVVCCDEEEGIPKNTLATVRKGDKIYFGIARCNFDAWDNFTKKQGRSIATLRATYAEATNPPPVVDGLVIGKSGMWGVCEVKSLPILLSYFDNIDEAMLEERNRKLGK